MFLDINKFSLRNLIIEHETTHSPMKDVRCQGIILGHSLLLLQAINSDSCTDPTAIPLGLEGCLQPQTVTRPLTLPSALAPPSTLLDFCLWDTGQEPCQCAPPRRTWSSTLGTKLPVGPETRPLCISTCCVFNLNTVSILRSICDMGKFRRIGSSIRAEGFQRSVLILKGIAGEEWNWNWA